jgi:hypothetical protein
MLEHAASHLTAQYATLRPGSLPPESLAQYFLDLVWLDGVIGGNGGGGGGGEVAPAVRSAIESAKTCVAL